MYGPSIPAPLQRRVALTSGTSKYLSSDYQCGTDSQDNDNVFRLSRNRTISCLTLNMPILLETS
jgi:hypothetical protein